MLYNHSIDLQNGGYPVKKQAMTLLLGKGWGAAASIPGNLVQGAMGMVIGLVLLVVLKRSKALEKLA